MTYTLTAIACGVITACSGSPFSTACTTEARSVFQLDVLDSASMTSAAGGSTLVVRSQTTVDSVAIADSVTYPSYVWFEDRVHAGTYSIEVRKSGYHTWSRTGIRVAANACHVTTFVHFTALLQHLN
jgi:hypothetical protein